VAARLVRLRAIVAEQSIQQHDLRGGLHQIVVDFIERAFSRRDQQPENEGGQRGDQPDAELDEILRILAQMFLGQNIAQPQSEQCGAEYARENDRSG